MTMTDYSDHRKGDMYYPDDDGGLRTPSLKPIKPKTETYGSERVDANVFSLLDPREKWQDVNVLVGMAGASNPLPHVIEMASNVFKASDLCSPPEVPARPDEMVDEKTSIAATGAAPMGDLAALAAGALLVHHATQSSVNLDDGIANTYTGSGDQRAPVLKTRCEMPTTSKPNYSTSMPYFYPVQHTNGVNGESTQSTLPPPTLPLPPVQVPKQLPPMSPKQESLARPTPLLPSFESLTKNVQSDESSPDGHPPQPFSQHQYSPSTSFHGPKQSLTGNSHFPLAGSPDSLDSNVMPPYRGSTSSDTQLLGSERLLMNPLERPFGPAQNVAIDFSSGEARAERTASEHVPATLSSDRMSIANMTNHYEVSDQVSDEGPYKCNYLGCESQGFNTQYLLNSHSKRHTDERPHYCPEPNCPKSKQGKDGKGGVGFKRKNEMKRHQLVHGSQKYICPFCRKEYPRPDNLQRHCKVHHTESQVQGSPEHALLKSIAHLGADGTSRSRKTPRRIING